jgi:hypothetical protein
MTAIQQAMMSATVFDADDQSNYYYRDTLAIDCECSDPQCPACYGDCDRPATSVLYRIDIDDVIGTAFCSDCADDAFESGLFVD